AAAESQASRRRLRSGHPAEVRDVRRLPQPGRRPPGAGQLPGSHRRPDQGPRPGRPVHPRLFHEGPGAREGGGRRRRPPRLGGGARGGARRDWEEGLRQEPTDEKSWVARGMARLAKDAPGALADFQKALDLNPRSLAALQNVSHVLARTDQTEEAVKVLDKAV